TSGSAGTPAPSGTPSSSLWLSSTATGQVLTAKAPSSAAEQRVAQFVGRTGLQPLALGNAPLPGSNIAQTDPNPAPAGSGGAPPGGGAGAPGTPPGNVQNPPKGNPGQFSEPLPRVTALGLSPDGSVYVLFERGFVYRQPTTEELSATDFNPGSPTSAF